LCLILKISLQELLLHPPSVRHTETEACMRLISLVRSLTTKALQGLRFCCNMYTSH